VIPAAWRGLLLTLVIALAAGFIGAMIGVRGAHSAHPSMPQGTVRQSVDGLLERDFKLTSDQKAKIQTIDEAFVRKHNLIWADIRRSNAELAGAVANDMTLNANAKTAIGQIESSVGELHTESILYVLDVRKVLNPDQQKRFDEYIVMALMRDPA
jgi:Spy/CpxP family protein refolding chaperone